MVNTITNKTGVVYTCVTGGYDDLHNHTFKDQQWDYICFSDYSSINDVADLSWKIKPLVFDGLDNVRNQRWHKLHPHILFPEYDKSIYIDTNLNVLNRGVFNDVGKAIQRSSKISIAPHPARNCIYDEFAECLVLGKDNKQLIEKQRELIRKDGFPERQGLFETNIMYREHHDDKIIALMNDWWWWIKNYSRRDQLSLTYVLWKHGMSIQPLSETGYRNSDLIEFRYGKNHITLEELRAREEKRNQRKLSQKLKHKFNRLLANIARGEKSGSDQTDTM
ncbi:MAG: DUF616 domain-containing protein [Geobacteraceae bacterium]|nr:DUF616 domain-containing protein [Geobacteraceae bacterium]